MKTDGAEIVDLDVETWNKVYEKLFGGFEDLNSESDSEDELDEVPDDMKTKDGYLKDGFVVEDGDMEFNSDSEEEEDWIPSQEESTEDSLEDDDEEEEEELAVHLAASSLEDEEEEEEESEEEIPEIAGDSNDELKEEEYEYNFKEKTKSIF